jgi:hypothetical protein
MALFEVGAKKDEIVIRSVKAGPGLPIAAAIAAAINYEGVPSECYLRIVANIADLKTDKDTLQPLVEKYRNIRIEDFKQHREFNTSPIHALGAATVLWINKMRHTDVSAFSNLKHLHLYGKSPMVVVPMLPPNIECMTLSGFDKLMDISAIGRLQRLTSLKIHESNYLFDCPEMATIATIAIVKTTVSRRVLYNLTRFATKVRLEDLKVVDAVEGESDLPVFQNHVAELIAPGFVVTANLLPLGAHVVSMLLPVHRTDKVILVPALGDRLERSSKCAHFQLDSSLTDIVSRRITISFPRKNLTVNERCHCIAIPYTMKAALSVEQAYTCSSHQLVTEALSRLKDIRRACHYNVRMHMHILVSVLILAFIDREQSTLR